MPNVQGPSNSQEDAPVKRRRRQASASQAAGTLADKTQSMPSPQTTLDPATQKAQDQFKSVVKTLTMVSYLSLIIAVVAIVVSAYTIYVSLNKSPTIIYRNVTTTTIPQNTSSGTTLAGIDTPLNATMLAIINNAPNSYFQKGGQMYLNGTISSSIYPTPNKVNKFIVNNKTSVIYLGSITCIFCGENRWAMALALSRFGNFSSIFYGYSSLGDGDVPTLYWTKLNYSGSSEAIGSHYSSPYINFIPIEDTNPITGGFNLNTPSKMAANLAQIGNKTYINAFSYILNLSNNKTTSFQGTPYTIWGTAQFNGADAIDFGGTTPTGQPELSLMTHAQILRGLSNPNTQFSWIEYAAADVYVAAICNSISNSSAASIPACSLPSIKALELQIK